MLLPSPPPSCKRYLSYFRQSGKFTVAYMKIAGEKEYYLASAFEEIYAPPTASLSLRGFSVSGKYVRSVHGFQGRCVLVGAVTGDRGKLAAMREMGQRQEHVCRLPYRQELRGSLTLR